MQDMYINAYAYNIVGETAFDWTIAPSVDHLCLFLQQMQINV